MMSKLTSTALFAILLILSTFSSPAHARAETERPSLEVIQQVYGFVDPTGSIPTKLLTSALSYYHAHLNQISNHSVITVVDFAKNSSLPRFYVVNMKSGSVWSLHVAHGKGSDPEETGFATIFGNQTGSDRSSLGYFLTAETYSGKHGLSLRIDGLSATNSNVREREVVVHGADYVHDVDEKTGRSDGCFAVPDDDHARVIDVIKGGSLIYAGRSS